MLYSSDGFVLIIHANPKSLKLTPIANRKGESALTHNVIDFLDGKREESERRRGREGYECQKFANMTYMHAGDRDGKSLNMCPKVW